MRSDHFRNLIQQILLGKNNGKNELKLVHDKCGVMECLKVNVSDVFAMRKLQLATDM